MSNASAGHGNMQIHYEILVWQDRKENWEIHSCFSSCDEAKYVGYGVFRRWRTSVRLVRCEYDATTGRHRENVLLQIPHEPTQANGHTARETHRRYRRYGNRQEHRRRKDAPADGARRQSQAPGHGGRVALVIAAGLLMGAGLYILGIN